MAETGAAARAFDPARSTLFEVGQPAFVSWGTTRLDQIILKDVRESALEAREPWENMHVVALVGA